MVMNINITYCGDHFTMYTNIKPLHCMPDTNTIMLCVNYMDTSIKKKC